MVVIAMDGFNWNGGLLLPSRYESANAEFVWSSVTLRYMLRCQNNKHVTYNLGDQTDETLIVGFKLNIIATRFTTGDQPFLLIQDSGGATQVSLDLTEYPCYLKIAGVISSGPLYINNWHHIELKIHVSNVTDECVVRVDGVEAIDAIGEDTQAQSTNNVEKVSFSMGNDLAVLVDDFYVLDENGFVANDFIGPRARIEVLRPNGNGNSNDFVGSDADSTDNYLHVNETIADDDISYVESSTVGHKDGYLFGSLFGSVEEVMGLQTMIRHKKDKSGVRTIKHYIELHDFNIDGLVEHTLSDNYEESVEIWDNELFMTISWLEDDINILEAGIKVQA